MSFEYFIGEYKCEFSVVIKVLPAILNDLLVIEWSLQQAHAERIFLNFSDPNIELTSSQNII